VEPNASDDILNRDALLERIGGDMEFLKEIAEVFVEDTPKLLTEIRSAISHGNPHALEYAAHSVKGSASNLGAERARVAAHQLELLGRKGDLEHAGEACSELEFELARFTNALNSLANRLERC
jgi:two-component system, sensor histidine kinase and response regulator